VLCHRLYKWPLRLNESFSANLFSIKMTKHSGVAAAFRFRQDNKKALGHFDYLKKAYFIKACIYPLYSPASASI
jgi:hypothetical protein